MGIGTKSDISSLTKNLKHYHIKVKKTSSLPLSMQ